MSLIMGIVPTIVDRPDISIPPLSSVSQGLLGVSPRSVVEMSHHTYHLHGFFLQPDPAKDLHQYVELSLQPLRLRIGKEAIVIIGNFHHSLHSPPKSIRP